MAKPDCPTCSNVLICSGEFQLAKCWRCEKKLWLGALIPEKDQLLEPIEAEVFLVERRRDVFVGPGFERVSTRHEGYAACLSEASTADAHVQIHGECRECYMERPIPGEHCAPRHC